ncbi:hypothetical protein TNCV_540761 [Trichonephila clavipes]|nr:hypothetical protein TNCV_540761 [Trichonephila clavipes]
MSWQWDDPWLSGDRQRTAVGAVGVARSSVVRVRKKQHTLDLGAGFEPPNPYLCTLLRSLTHMMGLSGLAIRDKIARLPWWFLRHGRREENPGWRELEESAKKGILDGGGPRVEWKERRDDERRWRWRIGVI